MEIKSILNVFLWFLQAVIQEDGPVLSSKDFESRLMLISATCSSWSPVISSQSPNNKDNENDEEKRKQTRGQVLLAIGCKAGMIWLYKGESISSNGDENPKSFQISLVKFCRRRLALSRVLSQSFYLCKRYPNIPCDWQVSFPPAKVTGFSQINSQIVESLPLFQVLSKWLTNKFQ